VQPLDKSKALVPIVHRILLERWDPIGVNDFPEAQNEYDSYVPGVIALLINGSSAAEIAAHLGHSATHGWSWGRARSTSCRLRVPCWAPSRRWDSDKA